MQNQHTILKTYFGYDSFRTGQAEIVDAILAGEDALAIMPTGAGKSICYQIPAMLFEGVTLVVSPLIALMKDQVNALVQLGIPAAYVNSSLSPDEQADILYDAAKGAYKLLYIAPEQLETSRFTEFVAQVTIPFISIDEAHCVSQWGHDFRPGYLKVHDFIATLPTRPIIGAFTATATQQVKDDIAQLLKLQNPFTITTGFNRANLSFAVEQPSNKMDAVTKFVEQHTQESGIIYCSTRKDVEQVCSTLQSLKYPATRYHAGLSSEERMQNQEAFVLDEAPIMVATNAFGMGIDKSNVAYVVHYNMPKNMESYYQEAGRAGRDGTPAECLLLYSGKDVRTSQFFIEQIEENADLAPEIQEAFKTFEHERLKQMTFYAYTQNCLRQYILNYFGEKSEPYCGNCSNCLEHFERKDITVDAQKILSCVKRMQEQFGITLIVDVLRGSRKARILELAFDELPTHGALSTYSENQIRHLIQVLLSDGFLLTTTGQYPIIKWGPRAKELLFENTTLEINLPKPDMPKPSKRKTQPDAQSEHPELFTQLQTLRKTFASAQNVPAYIIFSNATLQAMCTHLPQTLTEMGQISGVGKIKLAQYGADFLAVIQAYRQ